MPYQAEKYVDRFPSTEVFDSRYFLHEVTHESDFRCDDRHPCHFQFTV